MSPTSVDAPQREAGTAGLVRVARAMLAACLLLPVAAARGEEPSAPFVMSTDVSNVRLFEYYRRTYVEAFRRLGVPLQVTEHALARRAALADEGLIDGEMARVRAYGDAHPRLVRVEEPIFTFSFALFTAKPEIRLERLEQLAGTTWVVEYRRGIMMCEKELQKRVPPERLGDLATTEQGVKKLISGRTDLFCDLDDYFVQEVLRLPAFRGVTSVRRVLRFATLPTYPYVGEKHAALAPRLAAVLKRMRAEGLLDRYLREAMETRTRE